MIIKLSDKIALALIRTTGTIIGGIIYMIIQR
ncbi:Uncharacterised protein [Lederbergia lenta]|uniref:Uncharacterized protein n=1 Tax=Lederbergia lenta TaxID=1467 RepID=A0A2X4W7Q0_LEDLE|nr:Uncharacterised protein [Lederbergia lenta]